MRSLIPFCVVAVIGLAGCGGGGGGGDDAPETPSAPTSAPTTGDVELPVSLFPAAAPAGAVALIDAKAAKAGDRIVFEARVGGSRDSFVEGRAIFTVADASIKDCSQLHGDNCPTPWDYCCEPKDNLIKHMATVQVVDDAGQPLKVSLQNQGGVDHSKTVVVSGVVKEAGDGVFIVNAEAIHVRES